MEILRNLPWKHTLKLGLPQTHKNTIFFKYKQKIVLGDFYGKIGGHPLSLTL